MRRSELDADPLRQFLAWFGAARAAGVPVPETMTLATATGDGRPSARQVLLKGSDERGFVFFSGYDSRKGRELAENPHASLLFHWAAMGRQVRVEGRVERVSRGESEEYWRTRPFGSRLSAAVSRQSEPIGSREELEVRVEELRASGEDPPLPEHWGGFRLEPQAYEFWEHRDDRLHDRFRYTRAGERWTLERLSP
jgi:pyridoxamine 5'-phosphate oxidase